MGEIAFTVPWPPSVNRYYRHVGPRVLISKDGRIYRREIEGRLGGLLREPLRGALALTAEMHPPDHRRRDLDNLGKALLDSLQHAGVFLDDSQIDELHIYRKEVEPNGSAEIRIRELQ